MTDDETVTYRELNRRANVIAHRVLECQLRPPSVVPLVMSLGAEKIAAAIGVSKSGLAWAALDQTLSDRDLGNLVAHSDAHLVLTDHRNHDRARSWKGGTREVLDLSALGEGSTWDNPEVPTSPNSIFDIRYTSGSTGAPKGVIRTDRKEQHHVDITTHWLKPGPHDRVAFNPGFWTELVFMPLCCGACLCLFDLKEQGLASMRTWMRDHEITVYRGMPTSFREFLKSLDEGDRFPSMRVVALIGEPVTRDDVLLFDRRFPKSCALQNHYGTTEHATIAEFVVDRERVPAGADNVPIGVPVSGAGVELLDEELQPVPPGEVGEIAMRGNYLSPGYWRAPELTKKTWIETGDSDHEPIYVTGDLAIAGPDGCLYLLGRKDERIKIRGYRMTPSEIEMVLVRQDGVKRAAIAPFPRKEGGQGLACYFVPNEGHEPTRTELRAFLRERVPHYMIPNAFVRMDDLPLTESGKVKRRCLPIPEGSDVEPDSAGYVAPRSDLESRLAKLWCRTLETDRLGVTDDFFELGGDSLLALILILDMERELGIEVDLGCIFAAPTIAQLVELLELGPSRPAFSVVPLQSKGDGAPLFCLRGIDFYRGLAESLGSDHPVLAIYLREELKFLEKLADGQTADLSIDSLSDAYCEAIHAYRPRGPYHLTGAGEAGFLALETACKLQRRGEDVAAVYLLDTYLRDAIHRDWPQWIRFRLSKIWRGEIRDLIRRVGRKIHIRLMSTHRSIPFMLYRKVGADDARARVGIARLRALRLYRGPQLPFDGKVILFRTTDFQQRDDGIKPDPDNGWGRFFGSKLDIHNLSGSHASIFRTPHVYELAEKMRPYLS